MAGREHILETAAIALDRIRNGRHAQSGILLGLRGLDKTVLLTQMRRAPEGGAGDTQTISRALISLVAALHS